MRRLFTFWYIQSPLWVYRSFLSTINILEGQFAVQSTLQNITKPLFQDYTLGGRFIGVLLRLGRIALGLFTFLIAGIGYCAAYAVWLCFPLLCVLSIIGSVVATS